MISLDQLLIVNRIIPSARWNSRKQVLQELSAVAADELGLKERDVFEGVLERERLGSTGVGEGVAIPHFRGADVTKPVGLFARLVEPVDFGAIDDRPCDLIFMLLTPEDAGGDHLRALARVARLFRQDQIRAALRKAQTSEAIAYILCPDQASDAA